MQANPRKYAGVRGYRKYQWEQLKRCKELYHAEVKKMSLRRISRQTQVPITTIQNRASGLVTWENKTSGPLPVLGRETENIIKDHLLEMAQYGYGLV